MAKKNSRRSATKNLATSYFTTKKTRRHAVPLSSKQVPMKIEGVRMKRSRWVAEIKHPNKKNVRIWLGSYDTQEEASKAYQSKKMEHEEIKRQAAKKEDKELVDDQEVESLSDVGDVAMKGVDVDDQAMEVVFALKAVDFNDQEIVPLPSKKQQVPIKIEGVRMRKSRWVAEIKHPTKKNVRMWLGSYATQEEASKVYQLKKTEHEKLKLKAIAENNKLVDQEVVSANVEFNAKFVSDDPGVVMKVVDFHGQATKVVDFNDANIVNDLKEANAESQSHDRDFTMNVVGSGDQATKVIYPDQAERRLRRTRVEQEAGNMLLQLGPVLIDRYGRLLGKFSWMDDLSIV